MAGPPSAVYTQPAAFTVSTSDAMLNAVRKCALRARVLNVHWLHALVPATSIVSSAPRSRRDAKSTAYDTDIVEPPEASGRFTFNADASDEQSSRATKRPRWSILRGKK